MTAVPLPRGAERRGVPPWLALALVVIGGAGAAAQVAVNAELGTRLDSPLSATVVSNTVGGAIFVVALCVFPRVREGVARAWRDRLPWWLYTGGMFGAVFVFAGAYAGPLVGVAVFTVAQVCGNSLGALATDAAGLGPGGRLRVTPARLLAALSAIGAVAVAQAGRDVTGRMWWLVPVIMVIGASLALQGAFNGRVNEITGNPVSTGFVNFVSGTGVLYVVTAVIAVLGGVPGVTLPAEPWLYLGGVFGAALVVFSMIAVRVIGVLRMALGILAGQLAGALVLDVVLGHPPSPWVAAGVLLTAGAVALASMSRAAQTGTSPGQPVASKHESVRRS
ncbi:transporter family-2 protein [Stackebrandtia albiflava]|uniref:Transporter family-2 protein n=1 Tax=Stackebrandtia albiflava TaxID=406432 RepID=A0A562VEG9_9ACTN|nr:DMT family transporter [Stackebrandtia albiflava]TWJ16234.1 transporter family-2 protein [Stackebrandtia albiflava]